MKQSLETTATTLKVPALILSVTTSICLVGLSFGCVVLKGNYDDELAQKEKLEQVIYMQKETLNEVQENYLALDTKAKKLDEANQQVQLDNATLTKENDTLEKEVKALKKQLQTLN